MCIHVSFHIEISLKCRAHSCVEVGVTSRTEIPKRAIKVNFFHSFIFLTNPPFVINPCNLLANYLEVAVESYGVHSQSTLGVCEMH